MQDYLNSTRRTVAWFKEAHDRGQLTMRPLFQRNIVWTEAQQSFLIDTILRGYPIPELYMQEEVDDKGAERHIVVDGQQRIKACLSFLEGKFALDAEKTPEWPDLKFDELGSEEKKRIFGYNFIVRQLPKVDDPEIRAIFTRLNRNNIVLNSQELRHATYWGPFIKCMESLAELEHWATFGVFTPKDVRRMLDIEFISELTIAFLHGVQNKKEHLDRYFAAYEPAFEDQARVEQAFEAVLGELRAVLPDITRTRWRKKSDFYSLFLLFAQHSGKLPLASDAREKATATLVTFGERVDKYISKPGNYPKPVIKYARAVEKAASDLANRRARQEALETQLKSVLR